jgi:hypothetical protein
MVRVSDGGGGEEGIDPSVLQSMISTMKSSTGNAATLVDSYKSQFSRYGLDTTNLAKAAQDLSWAQDQVPMLSRRQSLAQAAADMDPGLTVVTAGAESLGNFPTDSAAQQAGQQDAKKFSGGDMSAKDLYAKLAANQGDPAYCTALMKALGADGLRELEQYPPYDPNDPDGTANRAALAQAVVLAMWNGFTVSEPGYEGGQDGNRGREDPAALAGLLQYATFPPQVLADLGTACIAPGEHQYGNQVWQALGDDPAGATLFLHDNMQILTEGWMGSGSDHRGGLPDFQAANFAQVIAAGTTGGPGADQNLAADNATKLIQYYADNPGSHTHSEIQAAFAQIVEHYWPDLESSVTDPAPVNLGPGHVNVPASQWKAFIAESMQNATASADLLKFSAVQARALATSEPDNPEVQHASGLIDGFFASDAQSVYQQIVQHDKDQASKWQSTIAGQLNTALSTGMDVALNPEGAAATVAKAGIKDMIGLFSQAVVNVNSGNAPPPPSVVTWQQEWQKAVAETYQQHPGLGDPQKYAAEHGAQPFLNPDGTLVDNASSQQKQAYNAWLQDMAVAQASDQRFLELDNGRLDGVTG